MPLANPDTYLRDLVQLFKTHWPDNRTVNIACHGHSVPAGYFATPLVNTFDAYPHLLHRGLKERFPYAVINVVVTALGGENSECGAQRFERDVLAFHPDLVTIDYGLNDRGIGLERAQAAWQRMIEKALSAGVKLLLLTPTADQTNHTSSLASDLDQHAAQIRGLAHAYGVGMVDSLSAFDRYQRTGALSDLLSWPNHPNRRGHELVVQELLRWFPPWDYPQPAQDRLK
jgi:acyl-CoA thioesterase I